MSKTKKSDNIKANIAFERERNKQFDKSVSMWSMTMASSTTKFEGEIVDKITGERKYPSNQEKAEAIVKNADLLGSFIMLDEYFENKNLRQQIIGPLLKDNEPESAILIAKEMYMIMMDRSKASGGKKMEIIK